MKPKLLASVVLGAALVLAGCSSGSDSASDSAEETAAASAEETAVEEEVAVEEETESGDAAAEEFVLETVGPNGEVATLCESVQLTPEQAAEVEAGDYSAALLWHTSGDFVNAVNSGAKDAFSALGVEVVAEGDAAFDVAKQQSNVENALQKNPSVILGLPFDPVAAAAAYQPAVDAGVKLVFLSNTPDGFTAGQEHVTIVTDDLFQMGKQAADALAAAIGGSGDVAYIYHDANYYVTNQRDEAFRTTILKDYPNINLVAEQGLADPATAEETANALLAQNPNLAGIYVTWAEPAEGVLAALRNSGNTTTKIVTLDLSEPLALDMVQGGNVAALTADKAYQLGECMATAGALGLLGESVDPFLIAPALTVTADNVEAGWRESLNRDLPESVKNAIS